MSEIIKIDNEFLASIRPANAASKYSANLYRFLKMYSGGVFGIFESKGGGNQIIAATEDGQNFVGGSILAIAGGTNISPMPTSAIDKNTVLQSKTITTELMRSYLRVGVCAFGSFVSHRFKDDESGDQRTCQLCGFTQYKHTTYQPVISWQDQPQTKENEDNGITIESECA